MKSMLRCNDENMKGTDYEIREAEEGTIDTYMYGRLESARIVIDRSDQYTCSVADASKSLPRTLKVRLGCSPNPRICNVPRNQPDHITNPIKFSMITTT
jgi:hypothetical protein